MFQFHLKYIISFSLFVVVFFYVYHCVSRQVKRVGRLIAANFDFLRAKSIQPAQPFVTSFVPLKVSTRTNIKHLQCKNIRRRKKNRIFSVKPSICCELSTANMKKNLVLISKTLHIRIECRLEYISNHRKRHSHLK